MKLAMNFVAHSSFESFPAVILTTTGSGPEETVLRLVLDWAKQLAGNLGEVTTTGQIRARRVP
jgi:hypothetical protein